jgi:uncharacterized protein YndB with AHSA1/START domain
MTRDKDRKRIIRNRMKKTGESYTTARAHVISKSKSTPPQARTIDYAALAGMTDAAIAAKTGRTWQQWTRVLDADGAAAMPHRDIAILVHQKHRVGDWWSQTVTVGYERIKGLRERGQRRNGTYEVNRSRTFNVPVTALYQAWANDTIRRRWLDGVKATVRTARPAKSIRLQWPDDTLVVVGFITKGPAKSVVSVAHMKLRDKDASSNAKKYWTDRLDALASVLVT